MRLLRICLLGERTMLQGQSEGKTQGRPKCPTFSLLLCWISSICSSSPPSSILFCFVLFFPQNFDLYGLHQWASLPFWLLPEDNYLN